MSASEASGFAAAVDEFYIRPATWLLVMASSKLCVHACHAAGMLPCINVAYV